LIFHNIKNSAFFTIQLHGADFQSVKIMQTVIRLQKIQARMTDIQGYSLR